MESLSRLIAVQQRIAPEVGELVERRYAVLRCIQFAQPIGRRGVALKTGYGERKVRADIASLREQGLVTVDTGGIMLTREGEKTLADLGEYVRELRGLARLEEELRQKLSAGQVVVVSGDSDQDPSVKKDMGKAAARLMREIVRDDDVISVGGGTTMAEVANALTRPWNKRNVTFVPARGSLGDDVEKQADTIAALMAKNVNAAYRLLNVPDDLRAETLSRIALEPRIKEILEVIHGARIVVHGIGTIDEMARRRRLPPDEVALLRDKGAVAEMFGYYFDARGAIVHVTPSMGLRPEDLEGKEIMAVAGGTKKALAIVAVMANRPREILVTDEGAARAILAMR
ncbi:MAG TPA: hypothetical protein GX506_09770 [Firmicutes bacterium]|nr:hypothetical protein [Bacillota bacterium]